MAQSKKSMGGEGELYVRGVQDVVKIVAKASEAMGDDAASCADALRILARLDGYGRILSSPRFFGLRRLLSLTVSALERNDIPLSRRRIEKLARSVAPVADDAPAAIGDKVSVKRTKRGWYDGTLEGFVTSVEGGAGTPHSYTVRDDEGNDHEVEHTRDLRRIG